MEGGVAKLARTPLGPLQAQKGEVEEVVEVPVTNPSGPGSGSILIRAPVSDEFEDDDNDKESFDAEEGGEEEYFESASERMAGSPVGSFTNNNPIALSVAKVRGSDSDSSESSSLSSSSSSSAASSSKHPRIRLVAKLSGDDDEHHSPREELVNDLDEEEGFTVAKVPPLGFVKERGLEGVEMAGVSEGSPKAFLVGTGSPERTEPGVGDGPSMGLQQDCVSDAAGAKGGVNNFDDKKQGIVIDAGEVVDGSRVSADSVSEQDRVAAEERKETSEVEEREETSEVVEREETSEVEGAEFLEKAGAGVDGSGNDESDGVGIGKAADGTALLENNDGENGGTVEREFVGAREEKSETDGIQGAEENSNASQVEEVIAGQNVGESAGRSESEDLQKLNGGIHQASVGECVPEDVAVDVKEGDDKGADVKELTVKGVSETGVVEVQAAAKEDAPDDPESYREKLVQENVTADSVKAIECCSVKEECTQDSNANEKYDAEDSKANEVATVSPLTANLSINTEGTIEEQSVESESKHEVATVEQLDCAPESKYEVATVEEVDDALESKREVATDDQLHDARENEAEDNEKSKDVVELSQREVQGSSESKENIESEVLPDMNEMSDDKPQSNAEYSSGDHSIQKIADDEDGGMVDSSDVGATREVGDHRLNVSSVDYNLEKVSNKESNANESYFCQDKANEVASASYVTSQQAIDKEDIVETGSAICDHSLLKSESIQGSATTEKPDDTQEIEQTDMHQGKAVENQTTKGLDFTDETTRKESNFGLESQNSQSVEKSKEAMLGSLGLKERNDSSKPEASPDDSDTLMKMYFPTSDQDNKDNDLDDEETLASYVNPQFTFESSSGDDSIQKIVGRKVTDWGDDEDDDEDDEDEDEEMVDPSALAALMEVASSAVTGSNNSSFGAAGFSVSTGPAGLGASVPSLDPMPRYLHHSRLNGAAVSRPSPSVDGDRQNGDSGDGYDETQEKLQMIRVKFLRVVQRLGQTPQNVVVTQVLYRLGLAEGLKRGSSANRVFNSDRASTIAAELEATRQEDLDFTCNILVLGKTGVGKSATINSIFDESKSATNAFHPATGKVREILGSVHGIKVRVVDTPGLMPSSVDQRRNKNIISSVQKFIKKCPPDIVLYFDRLDIQSRDYSDLSLLKLVTETFGAAIWFNTIVVLTHASSAPPDGANGTPLSYDMFVAQRSHIVQHSIRQAAGDMRLMNPVSLVENHSACRRNREGQRVLPNGQVWKPQLLLLCLSSKVLAEANALLKLQESTPGKPLGLRTRAPPLPYLLSSLLQSRAQLKAPDEDGEEIDSDEDLGDVSDSEGEDEYERLPPFKYLTKSQLSELTKEQREAYYDEKYYREKLYQKKQWKEELRRRRNMKKKPEADKAQSYRDDESNLPEPEAVPMPDMVMPQTFDSDNPTYRYRYLDSSSSQWLIRPVLDTNGWDHDTGYDGVNVERMLVIRNKIPASVSGQITKDKKEANFQMDCSASLKHGEHRATLASFDVQSVGRGLAYTLRSETRFSNFKGNKTAGGISLTYLGNTLATGMKLEDSLTVGKRVKFVVNGGAMMGRGDVAYGGSLEATLRDKDYPIGQMLTTMGISVMNWHGDLAIGGNLQSQFGIGRKWKVVTRASLNNRRSGQISIRTSSSDQLQIALIGLIPIIRTLIRGRLFDPPYSA